MYAIKVPFGNPEDKESWIYVTEPSDAEFHDIKVKCFDSFEDAEKHAKLWRFSEVVEYTD